MRVVGGEARGRRLKTPKTEGTRPIMDRVKTALFDILSWRVEDARFLDLFAGTGSVGIEALSRGAATATFVELDQAVLQLVRENLAITRLAQRAETVRTDAFAYVDTARAQGRQYDIIYVAPPQYRGLAARAVARLDVAPLTPPGGLVIAQVDPRERGDLDALALGRLRRYDDRRYGSTLLLFYEDATPERADANPNGMLRADPEAGRAGPQQSAPVAAPST
jgi:16S rRNA (guanine966-N2)-methyltransferase